VELLNLKGTWDAQGKFIISPGKYISCAALADLDKLPLLEGTSVNLIITFDARELITGRDGIVWATKHLLQAEIVSNALFAQNFNVEILNRQLADGPVYLLQLSSDSDVNEVVDFIWRGENGLRLKPDWSYREGETNKSFEKWVNG
jgi:hypothetical protein